MFEKGLKAPDFEQKEDFKVTFWRNVQEDSEDESFGDAAGSQIDELTDRQIEICKSENK